MKTLINRISKQDQITRKANMAAARSQAFLYTFIH